MRTRVRPNCFELSDWQTVKTVSDIEGDVQNKISINKHSIGGKMRAVIFMLAVLFSLSQAGVITKAKTTVKFTGTGSYTTENTSKLEGLRRLDHTKTNFEGKGFATNLMIKMFLKSSDQANIIDLPREMMVTIDYKEKTWQEFPMEKINWDEYSTSTGAAQPEPQEQPEQEESTVKIIRQEFKVNETGQTKTINTFDCREFTVLWLTEWLDTETKEGGVDSLFTTVWTTDLSKKQKAASEQEMAFSQAYLKKVGLDMSEEKADVLGLGWLNLFAKINAGQAVNLDEKDARVVREIQKIHGYPVVTDGAYYFRKTGQNAQAASTSAQKQEEERPQSIRSMDDVRGAIGSTMFKKLTDKKKEEPKAKPGPKPAFSWLTELQSIEIQAVAEEAFQAPAKFKKIETAQ